MEFIEKVAQLPVAILLGAAGGGLIGAVIFLVTWWLGTRENMARQLLSESLDIRARKEAWIVDGPNPSKLKLSENRFLSTDAVTANGNWLRNVEVRAVLDEAQWNSPPNMEGNCNTMYYGFIDGKRVWIVRDEVTGALACAGAGPGDHRPALLSSGAIQELCAWIERVTSAYYGWMLSKHGLQMLQLLKAVATEDRVRVFENREPTLTQKAKKFLDEYRKNHK